MEEQWRLRRSNPSTRYFKIGAHLRHAMPDPWPVPYRRISEPLRPEFTFVCGRASRAV